MIKKIRKQHIAALLIFLVPFLLIGISNYFFSSASYVLIDGARQWVGSFDGLLMTLSICITLTALWIAFIYTGYLDKCINRITTGFLKGVTYVKENKKTTLRHLGILFAIVILALIAEVFISRFAPFKGFNALARIVRVTFYMCAGLSVYCLYMFRAKPEMLFLSLSLVIGFLYIAAHPPFWYGWDCGIHYAWSVEESFFRTVSVSRADLLLAHTPEYSSFFQHEINNGFEGLLMSGRDNVTEFSFLKNTGTFAWSLIESNFLYTRIAHIPAGILIFIGRSIMLPPIIILKLGTVANHLIYTLLVYFAIKRLSSGKYLMAVIAMFPTSFVLSTTYGYDQWLIGFLMLGFAYFFYEAQNPETKISKKSLIIIMGSLFIGIAPKAVYLPMMLTFYFMKRDKFETLKGYRSYLISISCLILFALLSFAAPFIAAGGGEGDWRGGENVNGALQTLFVLENPFTYVWIFLRFLMTYINIFSHNYITYFAHLGYSSFYSFVVLLLGFVIITDRSKEGLLTSSIGNKVLMTFVTLATIALFSLAMYIGFTEVGAATIAGVQPRYLIPLMFPFLYVVGGFKIQNNINKTAYSCAVFGIMAFVLLTGAWQKFVLIT